MWNICYRQCFSCGVFLIWLTCIYIFRKCQRIIHIHIIFSFVCISYWKLTKWWRNTVSCVLCVFISIVFVALYACNKARARFLTITMEIEWVPLDLDLDSSPQCDWLCWYIESVPRFHNEHSSFFVLFFFCVRYICLREVLAQFKHNNNNNINQCIAAIDLYECVHAVVCHDRLFCLQQMCVQCCGTHSTKHECCGPFWALRKHTWIIYIFLDFQLEIFIER